MVLHTGSSRDSSIANLGICIAGIYVCYLSYGIFQEKIFTYRSPTGDKFTATLFMLFVQCVTNAAVAYAAMLVWKPQRRTMPLQPFAFTSFAYLGAMLCSNEALKHVSYPTQALGKSCKMIPVMLMGVLIRRKKYTVREYICVLLITIGIAVFQLGKASSKHAAQENSSYGLILLFLSLTLDGISGPKQEEISQTLRPSVHQQMFYTNLWAVIYTGAGALLTGQALSGFFFCVENPAILNSVFYFSICSALGQNFIYFTIQQFSALTCTTITTTRKFFTILFSVVWYGHELSGMSWAGVTIVFVGLGWELSSKYQKYQQQQSFKMP
ncbi:Drug/metabolite transporter [Globisporangium polare]